MSNKKKVIAAVVIATCIAFVVAVATMGCSGPTSAGAAEKAVSEKTSGEWGEQYPLQYNSYATVKINPYDGDKEGHFAMKTKELAPILKDEKGYKPFKTADGQYVTDWMTYNDQTGEWVVDASKLNVVAEADAYKKGCFSCRSSKFQIMEERDGAQIYDEKLDAAFIQELNGQEWDCGLCHAGDPGDTSSPATSQLRYFNEGAGPLVDQIPAGIRTCGQCHTTMSHTSKDHYRYGFEVDGIVDSKFEQGQTSFDPNTGITSPSGIYLPDLEMVQTSPMAKYGVTCVTCHMPSTSDDATGEKYTMHNASGSPLANEAALKNCLSCHESRGIKSTTEMADMVREQQEKAGKALTEMKERNNEVKAMIQTAFETGSVDSDMLDKARDKFVRANARYQLALGDPNAAGLKIAHNPDLTWKYIQEGNNMYDEVERILS